MSSFRFLLQTKPNFGFSKEAPLCCPATPLLPQSSIIDTFKGTGQAIQAKERIFIFPSLFAAKDPVPLTQAPRLLRANFPSKLGIQDLYGFCEVNKREWIPSTGHLSKTYWSVEVNFPQYFSLHVEKNKRAVELRDESPFSINNKSGDFVKATFAEHILQWTNVIKILRFLIKSSIDPPRTSPNRTNGICIQQFNLRIIHMNETNQQSTFWDCKGYITKPEVLSRLGVSSTTLHKWIRKWNFPKPFYLSKKIPLWVEDEILAWIESRRKVGSVE